MSTTPTPEASLAKNLGVSRETLKKMRRELQPGEDWELGAGGVVGILPNGEKKIRAALGLPEESAAEKQPAPRYATLTVISPAKGNRCIVLCRTATGEPARLRVRDNANFLRGMVVQTAVHEELDRYSYEGRLPRRKGVF